MSYSNRTSKEVCHCYGILICHTETELLCRLHFLFHLATIAGFYQMAVTASNIPAIGEKDVAGRLSNQQPNMPPAST